MSLTPRESQVVETLRRWRVATRDRLCQEAQASYRTVLRGLQAYGYYTSYNCNSSYYTLADIPVFDADGLWFHDEAGFSRYGTLEATLVALVQQSPAGYTVRELETRLQTRVANLLSLQCRRERLSRFRVGREVVYLSPSRENQERQCSQRQEKREGSLRASRLEATAESGLPAGLDARTVIAVLLELIRTPQADRSAQAQAIRARGTAVSARQVHRVVEFYGLEKKGAR